MIMWKIFYVWDVALQTNKIIVICLTSETIFTFKNTVVNLRVFLLIYLWEVTLKHYKFTKFLVKLLKPVSVSILLCFNWYAGENLHARGRLTKLQNFLQNFKNQSQSRYYYFQSDKKEDYLPVRSHFTKKNFLAKLKKQVSVLIILCLNLYCRR